MHEVMNQFVNVALIDADLILFVVDITDKKIEEKTVERLKTTDIPVFVLINKIMSKLDSFVGNQKHTDDITLIVLKRTSSKDYIEEI